MYCLSPSFPMIVSSQQRESLVSLRWISCLFTVRSLSYIDFYDCRNEMFPRKRVSSSRDTRARIWSPDTIIKGDPIFDSPPIGGLLVRTQRCSVISTRLSGNPVYRRRDSAYIIVESGSRRQRSSPRSSGIATRPDLADCCAKQAQIRASRENRNDSRRSQSLCSAMTARHLIHICQNGRKAFDRCNSYRPCHIFFSHMPIFSTNNHPLCLSSPKK